MFQPTNSLDLSPIRSYAFSPLRSLNKEQCGDTDVNSLFSEELYNRIDKFLDEEGLFITLPEDYRFVKSPSVLLLRNLSSPSSRSEASTVTEDDPTSPMRPSFLMRRKLSKRQKSIFASLAVLNTENGSIESMDVSWQSSCRTMSNQSY